ncbi:hypothetical protein [Snodgrassella alvi]|uniref:hypothetical protein n=1 Tax=Snodgrassella alvi TaxID=1196083 RepID=UPI001183BD92|nr:hypothetical protein [Snodgrassella alvi]
MSFTFYRDEQMTITAVNPYQLDFNRAGKTEFRLYFGSPYSYETLKPKSDGQIMLIPASRLEKWQPERGYSIGNIVEPTIANGCMYQVLSNGTTSTKEPEWSAVPNTQCSSGGVVFVNLGEKFQPNDIKMALTRDGLDRGTAGAALQLGEQLKGGKSIPVYFRINNASSTARSDRSDPSVSLSLNATITETIAHTGTL